jgi:hypothetical protein
MQQQNFVAPRLLTEVEAATYLSLRPASLRRWRFVGKGPRFCRVGGRAVRYPLSDLESFLADCMDAASAAKGALPCSR